MCFKSRICDDWSETDRGKELVERSLARTQAFLGLAFFEIRSTAFRFLCRYSGVLRLELNFLFGPVLSSWMNRRKSRDVDINFDSDDGL